jgi:hypothetical protein
VFQHNAASSVVIRDSIVSQGGIGGRTLLGGSSGGETFGRISNLNSKSGGGGGSDPNKGGYGSINAGNGGAGATTKSSTGISEAAAALSDCCRLARRERAI